MTKEAQEVMALVGRLQGGSARAPLARQATPAQLDSPDRTPALVPVSTTEERLARVVDDHDAMVRELEERVAPLRDVLIRFKNNGLLRHALDIKNGAIVLGMAHFPGAKESKVGSTEWPIRTLVLENDGLHEYRTIGFERRYYLQESVKVGMPDLRGWVEYLTPAAMEAAVDAWSTDFAAPYDQLNKLLDPQFGK